MRASSAIKGATPEEDALIAKLRRAGVFFHEVRRDPDHRLLITVAVTPKTPKVTPALPKSAAEELERLRAIIMERSGR